MKKICLTLVGIYLLFTTAFAQQFQRDTSEYKSTRLSIEEVNLVSGYYSQDGSHSAVTGGIGTQKLNDISNVLELKFMNWGRTNDNKYTLGIELGVDHHTAASQAYISKTGASKTGGTRIYPSLSWQVEKENKTTIGFGLSYSTEFNYHSIGANFTIGKASKNNNREISFKGQAFIDRVTLIEPSEFAPKAVAGSVSTYTTASGRVIRTRSGASSDDIPTSPRNTFAGSLTISQVVNKNFQAALIADVVEQNGLLSLPFHRVYFNAPNDTAKIENLPDNRLKIPIAMRMSYFLGDKFILRGYYRYYTDNWGIKAHTASLEIPWKISPFVSAAPFYRYYVQTAANYFAPYKTHSLSEKYFTSNYDLSGFDAHYAGINLRFTPQKGVLGVRFFNMLEIRYGHYIQSTGLHGDNIGLNLKFK